MVAEYKVIKDSTSVKFITIINLYQKGLLGLSEALHACADLKQEFNQQINELIGR